MTYDTAELLGKKLELEGKYTFISLINSFIVDGGR